MRSLTPVFLLGALVSLRAAEIRMPLPKAPVRVIIADVKAFNTALTGSYRQFLRGTPEATDPLLSAWRKTQVGSKLEDQWSKFAETLPLDWGTILKLQPRSLGLALLEVGNLEAVLVLDTPLATLPLEIPAGESKTHGGITFTTVVRGAGDASDDPERRMGLAWARKGTRLFLATSERALKLALDEAQGNGGVSPSLPGLISLELDLEALRKDRYFNREFLFEPGPETGILKAALRPEQGHLVEVREGRTEARDTVPIFKVSGAASVGWEPQGTEFWPAFRRGLLEPIPTPAEKPVPTLRTLPEAAQGSVEDRYAVDFTRPKLLATAAEYEKGELEAWEALLAKTPIPSWGYWVGGDGSRRMVFPWPEGQDAAFLEACRATTARRAGRATAVKVGDTSELRVGPGLSALALRRTGAYLWVGHSAASLKDAPTPQPEAALVRWAHLDLGAVRREAARWAKVEGPGSPEQVRPFSDRVLGLLGWMPATRAISVERRKTPEGWRERITFAPPKP